MKPKIIDIFVVFDPETIYQPYDKRPYDRAFFDSRSAIQYQTEFHENHLTIIRLDCEVPKDAP